MCSQCFVLFLFVKRHLLDRYDLIIIPWYTNNILYCFYCRYVLMRAGAKTHEQETLKKTSIPITVRQLEAIVRISESLAKMKMQAFAGEEEVDEAIRLVVCCFY